MAIDGHVVEAGRPFLAGKKETYATVLLAILFRAYGVDVLNWDPLTVEAQVKDDFKVDMPGVVYDQVMGLINCLTNDSVYRSVEAFDRTVNALTRCGAQSEQSIPSSEDVAWTVFEITANDPDPYEQGKDAVEWPFSHDIALYCGVVLADDGLKRPPKTLEFAVMPGFMPHELRDSPDEMAEAWGSQMDRAEDVDRFVQHQFKQLVSHLQEIGVEPAPPLLERAKDLPEENPLDRLLPS